MTSVFARTERPTCGLLVRHCWQLCNVVPPAALFCTLDRGRSKNGPKQDSAYRSRSVARNLTILLRNISLVVICSCCCDITFMKRAVIGLTPESTSIILECCIVVYEVVRVSISARSVPLRWIAISQLRYRNIQRRSLVVYPTKASIAGNSEQKHSQWLRTGPYTSCPPAAHRYPADQSLALTYPSCSILSLSWSKSSTLDSWPFEETTDTTTPGVQTNIHFPVTLLQGTATMF